METMNAISHVPQAETQGRAFTQSQRVPRLSGATSAVGRDSRREAFRRLVDDGVLTADRFEQAIEDSVGRGIDLERYLMEECHLSGTQLGAALSAHYGRPYVPFDRRKAIPPGVLKQVKIDYLRRHHWAPLSREQNRLTAIIDNPADMDRVLDIQYAFPGTVVDLVVGLRLDIARFLDAADGGTVEESIQDILGELIRDDGETEVSAKGGEEAVNENTSAIVRLVNQIILEAHRLGASDIHLEPYSTRKDMVVRFRVDGACFTYMKVPAAYRRAMVSRLKIMANLDIAESRKPQDGKVRFRTSEGKELELRMATLPTSGQNEDVVLRILTSKGLLPLEGMDLSPELIASLKHMVARPYGILLCVGPTGSGKTTTLHALLSHINDDSRKIWTVEDPIEITQDGLRQLQVFPKIGLTFASALRAFLRADPDVIMVGEMRDKETADIAIEASLTGHLVLSTLHTNSAVETVTRLLDMGCDSFNFADAMIGVLAKRLCRRLCERCKESYRPAETEWSELRLAYGSAQWERLGFPLQAADRLWRAKGCEACAHTGFKGRVALYELLPGSDELKVLIQTKARTHELLRLAAHEGMLSLVQDGVQKVLRGETTLQEVRKVAVK